MPNIQTWGIGRVLAITALVVIVVLIVIGQLPLMPLGVILLLLAGAVLF